MVIPPLADRVSGVKVGKPDLEFIKLAFGLSPALEGSAPSNKENCWVPFDELVKEVMEALGHKVCKPSSTRPRFYRPHFCFTLRAGTLLCRALLAAARGVWHL